ncbi:DNA-binding transcriptional regulator [Thalassoglobus sp. JC818]|uniref:AraC family transcriptional regulator n=1 Tax=Thalassoglobus sp. JC818 TaxID=3232136 RepID=UPI00345A565B
MRKHDEWSVFLEQRDLSSDPPLWLNHWNGDGILSRATTSRLADAVAAKGIPLVELTDRREDLGFCHVWSDDAKIGKLAAEHLLDRGFRHLAFCGFSGEAWSERRQNAYENTVRQKLGDSAVYNSTWFGTAARPWEEEQEHLSRWINELEKPVGIFACNDVRGQQILDTCFQDDVAVPEEVAVIGVDNDEILCQLCRPPLSSVVPNAELVGYRAAETLSKLMNGEHVDEPKVFVPPLGISTRQSTDVVAIEDQTVASALRFIRENACSGITVEDVLQIVPMSRSSLERKMRKYLNRSPQQEIRKVQVKRAQQLLTETDLPLEKIANLCGFQHPEYMHVVFRREIGQTPGAYRKRGRT